MYRYDHYDLSQADDETDWFQAKFAHAVNRFQ